LASALYIDTIEFIVAKGNDAATFALQSDGEAEIHIFLALTLSVQDWVSSPCRHCNRLVVFNGRVFLSSMAENAGEVDGFHGYVGKCIIIQTEKAFIYRRTKTLDATGVTFRDLPGIALLSAVEEVTLG
jgi:hypothetical protein